MNPEKHNFVPEEEFDDSPHAETNNKRKQYQENLKAQRSRLEATPADTEHELGRAELQEAIRMAKEDGIHIADALKLLKEKKLGKK